MAFDWLVVFDPYHLWLLACGTVMGIVWASIPGLSINMALALLLGLTYGMPASEAVVFMLAVLVAGLYGGAISAILINIPGTPDSVPTQMAGFPLALRGQGGLALGCALFFSMIGNWIGLLFLMMFVPVILGFALMLASWEIALLALLGVAISGTIAGEGEALKGWISGFLGLGLGFVGTDLLHGVDRFSFGLPELSEGISIIPVMIGLFGVSEILWVLRQQATYSIPREIGRFHPPLEFIRKYWPASLRSGLIGTIIGAIPGAGASLASFLSYNVGEQFSKKDFSKGSFEGVICAEVANNANAGGSLLPTLTLGIPGNNTAALLLGALNLHGVVVGPTIARDHPGFMTFVYATLILANVFVYVIGMATLRPNIRLFSLPRELMMPVIAVFRLIGAYVLQYSELDITIMFVFGMLGLVMNATGFPVAPLILGMILAPMLDENLRRAFDLYHTRWEEMFSRPIGLVLLGLVVWTFVYGVRKSRRQSRAEHRQEPPKARSGPSRRSPRPSP